MSVVLALALVLLVSACWTEETDYSGNVGASKLAVIGDSLSWAATTDIHTAFDPDHAVRIEAVTGQTLGTMRSKVPMLAADDPEVVVIELGTNDVIQGVATETSIADLDAIIAAFPGACSVVTTVNTHVPPGSTDPVFDNSRAETLNAAIRARGVVVADWDLAVGADQDRYFTATETIHPNAEGQALLVQTMRDAVDAGCPQPTAVSLTADAPDAALGAPVTWTASVSRAGSSDPVASGSVAFVEGATLVGEAPVVDGSASVVVSGWSAGAHEVVAVFAGGGGLAGSSSVPVSVVVARAAVTVTAGDAAMVWGGEVPAVEPVVSGLVAGFGAASFVCGADAVTGPGVVPTWCTGPARDDNYEYVYVPGSLTVAEPEAPGRSTP